MEDLEKDRILYKVMWLPDEKEVIWKMSDESQIKRDSHLYSSLNSNIDLNQWLEEFSNKYQAWLDRDNENIYDINYSLNKMMLEAIEKSNKKLSNETLFYWFDVDRSINEGFVWKYCPLTNEPLVDLSNNYYPINRLISPKKFLVFPHEDSWKLK